MKKGDYQSLRQVKVYHQKRFSGGLCLVHQNEMAILDEFLSKTKSHQKIFLDLGTGTGRVIKRLRKHKPEKIYVLDSSRAMLDYLSKLFPDEIRQDKVKPLLAPANKIPLKGKVVDIITGLHFFKHLDNISPAVKESARVLKSGGYLIFDVLNKKSVVRLNLGSCYALTLGQLEKKLKDNKFEIQKVAYLHAFGETVYNLFGKSGARLVHFLDRAVNHLNLKIGTKIFVLAKKK